MCVVLGFFFNICVLLCVYSLKLHWAVCISYSIDAAARKAQSVAVGATRSRWRRRRRRTTASAFHSCLCGGAGVDFEDGAPRAASEARGKKRNLFFKFNSSAVTRFFI